MEQAAILKSGDVVKLTGLMNPKYTIYGFLNSFEKIIDKKTKKFRQLLFSDFREEDQNKDSISGFYEEQSFLEYLTDKENKFHLLKQYEFKLATVEDEITVKRIKVVDPYIDFCKIETYKWAYEPNVPVFDYYGTLQIIIPPGKFPNPLQGENINLKNTAMRFYADKIKRFVSPKDVSNKQEKALLIAKIALCINTIELDLYSFFSLNENTDFTTFLSFQTNEWINEPIFVNPTVEILEDYYRNLYSFYKDFYNNQIFIKKAAKKDKFYWLSRALSAEALAIVPAINKFQLLYDLSKQNVTLTERNGGESLALKIIESFTFDSVSSVDRNDLLDDLVNFHDYITLQGGNGPHAVESRFTLFEILYKDIDDDRKSRYTFGIFSSENNRMKFVLFLYKVWYNSKFNPIHLDPSYVQAMNTFGVYAESHYMRLKNVIDSSLKVSQYFNDTTTPPFLIYETVTKYENGAKIVTNTNYTYKMVGKSIEVYETKITSDKRMDNHYSPTVLYAIYDFLQPVTVIGLKPDLDLVATLADPVNGTSLGNQQIHTVPAFLLFYMEDYSNLKKIDFGVMLTAEIALNLTGVGALSQLRYIGYLSKMRFLWSAETVVASDVVLGWKAVSGVVNAFEFTAINALSINNYILHTTNDSDTKKLAEKMNSYLFWATIGSLFLKPYIQSKIIDSAFELDNVVEMHNRDGISIYRPGMTPTQITELKQALAVVKNLVGNKALVVNTMIQKLTEYGTDSEKILQKYTQITSTAEKYAFYLDYGLLEDTATRAILNANGAKAIENWRICYANNITVERKYISILTNEKYASDLVRFYKDGKIRTVLEPMEIAKKERFLSDFSNLSDTHFANFVENPNLIKEWEKYSFVSTGNDLSILSREQKFKFLKAYENSTQLTVDRIKNGGLIKYYKIVDENPLNAIVHNSHIKNVDFLEDLHNTFTLKKQYPVDHENHPGLQETIANHVKGSPVMLNHNGGDYIIGYTGMHADYAITEPNPITLIEATLPGGKKYYPTPLPTVNANIQTAIIDGTEFPGLGAKDCEVWMWGYVTKKVDRIESLYLDINGNPIKTWVKKSNSNKTTIFTGMNEDKVLIEITYARHNLTLDDWIQIRPNRSSNTWVGKTSEGGKIHLCIGTEVMIPPTAMPSRTLHYGTVIPKK